MRVDFPYLMSDEDRHGNRRLYARKNGRKIRIREKPGTEAFAQAYADALQAIEHGDGAKHATIKGALAGDARLVGSVLFRFTGIHGT
jgi:hypothetical protein